VDIFCFLSKPENLEKRWAAVINLTRKWCCLLTREIHHGNVDLPNGKAPGVLSRGIAVLLHWCGEQDGALPLIV
jgi:hypothetical protein